MAEAAAAGNSNDTQNRYEVQNYTSLIHGNHVLKFGGRFRATQDTNYSTAGFNSTFTFSSLIPPPSSPPPPPCTIGANPPCPISLAYALGQIQNPSGNGGQAPYATQLTYTDRPASHFRSHLL